VEQLDFVFNLFDQLSQPGQRMAASVEQVEKSLHRASGEFDKFERHSQHAGHAASDLGQKLEELKHHIDAIGAMVGAELFFGAFEFGAGIIEHVVDLVKDLGKEIINAAGTAERQALSFKLLLGPEGAEETLRYIEEIAKHTEYTRTELKGLATEAITHGFEQEDLPRLLATVADIATFRGGGIGQAQEALSALERIKLTGRLDARALRPLGLKEQEIFDALAREMGMERKELEQAISEGKVDSGKIIETVQRAIAAREGGQLGNAAVAGGQTMLASLHKLRTLPEAFFEGFAETKGFAKLSEFLDKIVHMMDPSSEWGQRMMSALSNTFEALFGNLDPKDLTSFLSEALEEFLNLVKQFPEWINKIGVSWHDVIGVLRVVWEIFKGIGHAIEWIVKIARATWDFIAGFLHGIWDVLKAIGHAIKYIFTFGEPEDKAEIEKIASRHGMLVDQEGHIVDGMIEGIKDGQPELNKAMEGAARQSVDAHSPSRLYEKIGRLSAEGFAMGFASSRVDQAIKDNWASPPPMGFAGAQVGAQVTIQFGDIRIEGGGAEPADVAERVREIVLTELQRAFEQAGMETGVDR
jgi:tape measure domain-containing protein